jgi:hypothetical protein
VRLLFCSDPLSPARPDEMYLEEVRAAEAAGFEWALINFEALVQEGNAQAAVRRVTPTASPEQALYRGWMLRPEQYGQLYEALRQRGLVLLNDPAAYRHCHYLPDSYEVIRRHTPRTVWLPVDERFSMEQVTQALAPFGDQPLIVKDYVKSRKHEWLEACYIPSATDRSAVARVVGCFLERQGEALNEGLIFREFVSFQPIAIHARSGMPLTREVRCFFGQGRLLYCIPYWEEGAEDDTMPDMEPFMEVARQVRSSFFTMDLAQQLDGEWLIVELGDGQVAGLPDHANVDQFYRTLQNLTQ